MSDPITLPGDIRWMRHQGAPRGGVDLRNAEQVAHVLRWLGEMLLMGIGWPTLRRPAADVALWELPYVGVLQPRPPVCFHPEPRSPRERELAGDIRSGILVPALASIRLDHPDADLLALQAVVLRVVGRTS